MTQGRPPRVYIFCSSQTFFLLRSPYLQHLQTQSYQPLTPRTCTFSKLHAHCSIPYTVCRLMGKLEDEKNWLKGRLQTSKPGSSAAPKANSTRAEASKPPASLPPAYQTVAPAAMPSTSKALVRKEDAEDWDNDDRQGKSSLQPCVQAALAHDVPKSSYTVAAETKIMVEE